MLGDGMVGFSGAAHIGADPEESYSPCHLIVALHSSLSFSVDEPQELLKPSNCLLTCEKIVVHGFYD